MKYSHLRFIVSAVPNLAGSVAAELAVTRVAIAERSELWMHPLVYLLIQRLAVIQARDTCSHGKIGVAHATILPPQNMNRCSLFTRMTSKKNRIRGQFHLRHMYLANQ